MPARKIHNLIRQHGSQKKLAERLGVDASKISKLLNGYELTLKLAIKIETLTQGDIPAEQLLKHCKEFKSTELVKRYKDSVQRQVISREYLAYLIKVPLFTVNEERWPFCRLDCSIKNSAITRHLIVDKEKQLLSGFLRLQSLKSQGVEKTVVLIVDLTLLLEEGQPITAPYPLSILERMAIGFALEFMLKNWKAVQKMPFSCRNCDKISPRNDELIAVLCGFGSKDSYCRAKRVIKKGIPSLLDALNNQHISIYRASEIARLPGDQQQAALTDFLHHKQQQKELV